MKDIGKWKGSNNPSFDNPDDFQDKSKTIAQNGILSILGKNIGLLSRKHNKEKQKKYERSDSISKPQNKIRNFLHFKKPGDNKVTSSSTSKIANDIKKGNDNKDYNLQKKTTSKAKPVKSSQLSNNECGNPIKSIISNKKQNKSVKDPISTARGGQVAGTAKTKSFKQNRPPAPKSSKPAVERKVTKSKLRKSSSDSALNVTRARSSTSTSRPQSTLTSRCSSRTTINSTASSMVNTPLLAKKKNTGSSRKIKAKNKNKKKTSSSSSSPESPDSGHGSSTGSAGSPPVVFVNYRYQVRGG